MRKVLILFLLALPLLAQRPGRGKRAKPVKQPATEAEAAPVGNTPVVDPEMSAIRAVQVRARATYADACRIVLLQRGEFLRYKTDEERCRAVSDLGFLKTAGVDIYTQPISLGAVASLAIYSHDLERSMMFLLTGWSWYALSNAESLGLIPEGLSSSDQVSGAELMQIMDEALAQAESVKTWNSEENPYREFGYETYEEMYRNPAGPARR